MVAIGGQVFGFPNFSKSTNVRSISYNVVTKVQYSVRHLLRFRHIDRTETRVFFIPTRGWGGGSGVLASGAQEDKILEGSWF
jgi:hypothetical protein